MKKQTISRAFSVVTITLFSMNYAQAQSGDIEFCDDACQAQRNAQDPTAAVNGVFFDNTFGLGPTSDSKSYNLQVQPIVTALEEDWGSVLIRGIVPILGIPTSDGSGELTTDFGLSDSILQVFYIPSTNLPFAFGFGPQVSFATHTEDETKGAGWGAGPAAGGFGFFGPWSIGGLINHLWGEDDYSTSTIQPIAYYNFEDSPIGPWFIGYNAQISYDWRAESDNWQVPVGATVGKTFASSSGRAVTINLGGYELVETTENGNGWQVQFTANILF